MADKRQVKKSIKQLQRIKTWQLVIVLILTGLVSATFLRLNNVGMVERRAAVLTGDTLGNTDDIQNRLYDLQRYVSEHINANTGAIYLEHQYKRDSKKIIDAAGNTTNQNGNIYKKASDTCDRQFTIYSQAYLQCFLSELRKYPDSGNAPTTVALPPTELYRHEFVSPLWSPDFAGWSLVINGLIVLMIIARLVSLAVLKILLKRHYTTI